MSQLIYNLIAFCKDNKKKNIRTESDVTRHKGYIMFRLFFFSALREGSKIMPGHIKHNSNKSRIFTQQEICVLMASVPRTSLNFSVLLKGRITFSAMRQQKYTITLLN